MTGLESSSSKLLELPLEDADATLAAVAVVVSPLATSVAHVVEDPSSITSRFDGTTFSSADLGGEHLLMAEITEAASEALRNLVNGEPTAMQTGDATVAWVTWCDDPLDGARRDRARGAGFAAGVSRRAAGRLDSSVAHYLGRGGWLVAMRDDIGLVSSPVAMPTASAAWCSRYAEADALVRLAAHASGGVANGTLESTPALFELAFGRVEAAVHARNLRSWSVAPLLHVVLEPGGHVADEYRTPIALRGVTLDADFIVSSRRPATLAQLVGAVSHPGAVWRESPR